MIVAATRSGARRVAAAVLVLALLGSGAAGWRRVHRAQAAPEGAEAGPRRDVPFLDGSLIRYSPEFAGRAGIQIAPAAPGDLSPLLTVTGTVAFDPRLTSAVGARIAGRVRDVRRFEGDAVRAGDVLAEVESAELGQAQAAVVAARARADEATSNERREGALADARVSSEREAEQARAAAATARAELLAAEQRVRALGGQPDAEVGILLLRSPIPGKVVDVGVARGQSVEPTTTAFRVADLRRVWVELAVFERELGAIHAGDRVEIAPQADPSAAVSGTVARVGDVIDLDTRSADVRVVVENADESLRPGQSVLARIHTARSVPPTVVVPRDAVVSVDGRATIFVVHGEGAVEPRAVVPGARDAARVEIARGLQPGERVVVKGVFALQSELFR